jgi:hypothetical protein
MTAARTERHETAVVRRLVDGVMNERRLDVLDELCTPSMARRWRHWVTRFRRRSRTCGWRSSSWSPRRPRWSGASRVRPRTGASGAVTRRPAGDSKTSTRSTSSASKTGGSPRLRGSRTRSITCASRHGDVGVGLLDLVAQDADVDGDVELGHAALSSISASRHSGQPSSMRRAARPAARRVRTAWCA